MRTSGGQVIILRWGCVKRNRVSFCIHKYKKYSRETTRKCLNIVKIHHVVTKVSWYRDLVLSPHQADCASSFFSSYLFIYLYFLNIIMYIGGIYIQKINIYIYLQEVGKEKRSMNINLSVVLRIESKRSKIRDSLYRWNVKSTRHHTTTTMKTGEKAPIEFNMSFSIASWHYTHYIVKYTWIFKIFLFSTYTNFYLSLLLLSWILFFI